MSLQDAIKEAYALAKSDIVILNTLEIVFTPLQERIFLVSNTQDVEITLENAEVVTCRAVGMQIELPAKDDKGFQDLNLAISNTNLEVSDFITSTLPYDTEILCYYRPYLSNDLSFPQMDPPLVLYLSEAEVDSDIVRIRASFADVLNRKFLNQNYTTDRFPAL